MRAAAAAAAQDDPALAISMIYAQTFLSVDGFMSVTRARFVNGFVAFRVRSPKKVEEGGC